MAMNDTDQEQGDHEDRISRDRRERDAYKAALEKIEKEPAPGSTIYCRRTAKEALDAWRS